jgi:SAM-dependent methyltransferase
MSPRIRRSHNLLFCLINTSGVVKMGFEFSEHLVQYGNGLSRRISGLGERLQCHALIYNVGIIRLFHHAALANAPHVSQAIISRFPQAKSIIDVGCGTGVYVAEFQSKGLRAVGCEYGKRPRRWAAKFAREIYSFDVTKPLVPLPGAPFDCAMSLEVGEHIPADLAERFVQFIAMHSGLVVFSAAQPRQGGEGHVNEQPKEYWIEKFVSQRFRLDHAATTAIVHSLERSGAHRNLVRNVMVFTKT